MAPRPGALPSADAAARARQRAPEKEQELSLLELGKQLFSNSKKVETSAFYGMAAAIPDRSMVESVARGFVDALYIA